MKCPSSDRIPIEKDNVVIFISRNIQSRLSFFYIYIYIIISIYLK